jgi:hypothetical protein
MSFQYTTIKKAGYALASIEFAFWLTAESTASVCWAQAVPFVLFAVEGAPSLAQRVRLSKFKPVA